MCTNKRTPPLVNESKYGHHEDKSCINALRMHINKCVRYPKTVKRGICNGKSIGNAFGHPHFFTFMTIKFLSFHVLCVVDLILQTIVTCFMNQYFK